MITYASLSEKGDRKINEDCVFVLKEETLCFCVVADGLGGHGRGELASSIAVSECVTTFKNNNSEEVLLECINNAHEALLNEQIRTNRRDDIKTTITLLSINQNTSQYAHVGDSRVYRFEGYKNYSKTKDHSVPQMLAMQGEIKESQIRFHEDRNRLIRVVGMNSDTVKCEVSQKQKEIPPVSFLLCSDGFWELIDEKKMCKLLKKSNSPEQWLELMESVVLKNGENKNMDNYSAVAVFIR